MVQRHIPTTDTSRGAAPTRRVARRVLLLSCCVALAVAGLSPAPTGAQADQADVDEARAALLAERAQATEALVEAEAALETADQAVVATEAALAALVEELADVESTILDTRAAREEPLEVRRAVALEVYMAGDPAALSMIQELVDGSSGIDGVRDRALYQSVIDWANANLDRLDSELAGLLARLAELEVSIPDTEDQLRAGRDQAAAARLERDALVEAIDEIDQRIRALNRAILTGLEVETVSTRPILVVKIDNVGGARPQQGLAEADIVIEELVESGLTRLAALYQSTGADPVGPIRSARTSDVHILANLGAPIFAYSGANLGVGGAVSASPLIDVGFTRYSNLYYRDSGRRAPHNLFSRTTGLWARATGASPPVSIFEFREDGEPIGAGARSAGGVDVSYGSTRVGFSWDPGRNGWARTQDGRPHTVVGGAQIAPQNVVVRFTDYIPSPADARSPEAIVSGSGTLWVLSAGQVVEGRWEQATPTAPTRWLDSDGEPIRLEPGRTWILLPERGNATLR